MLNGTGSGTGLTVPMDGFTLNPAIRYTPYDPNGALLAQMDTLRRANRYRLRIHVLPDDYNQPLQPYDTQQWQVQVDDGSYLWGVLFNQFDGNWNTVAPANILWQITEACNGLTILSDFTGGQAWTGFMNPALGRGVMLPMLMTQPRLFLAPGNINVELSNVGTTTTNVQLSLYFAEPCVLVEKET